MTNDAAVAWYYEFGDTGNAGPVTFGGDPGREAIEWAERYGHTLHYLYPATTVAELRAEVERLTEQLRHVADACEHETARADAAERRVAELEAGLATARRAIGDHHAPNDCYATGPLTGDEFLDLVQCPACAFLEQYSTLTKESP